MDNRICGTVKGDPLIALAFPLNRENTDVYYSPPLNYSSNLSFLSFFREKRTFFLLFKSSRPPKRSLFRGCSPLLIKSCMYSRFESRGKEDIYMYIYTVAHFLLRAIEGEKRNTTDMYIHIYSIFRWKKEDIFRYRSYTLEEIRAYRVVTRRGWKRIARLSIVRDFVSFRESSFPDENSVIDTFRSMPVRYVCKLGSVPFLRAMTLYEAKKHTCAQFEMSTISSSSIPSLLDVSFLLFLLLSKKLAPTMNVQSRDSIIPLFHYFA